MQSIQRMLRWFDPTSDEQVGEEPLRATPLSILRSQFDVHDDEQMVLCYPVEAGQREQVQRLVDHPIDLERFAYFIEADALEVHEPQSMMQSPRNR